jgi:lysophospholipase L1-like esterase
MWILLGVFALLGGQPSEAGTGDHAQNRQWTRHQGAQRAPSIERYAALGDSYTAGMGIPPAESAGCYRSERSYPHRIAERLGARLSDASCSGAMTEHAETSQTAGAYANMPQLNAVDRRTDLVTISLGVNDADFYLLLTRCLQVAADDPQGTPCRDSFQTPAGDQLLTGIPDIGRRLERVVRLVQRMAPGAQVVVIGYPQLVPESGTCPELPFAAGDYAYLGEFIAAVDTVIRTAARHTGTTYVDLLAASAGHDICAGEDAWVLGAAASPRSTPFHPFANEQRAVATLVVDALQDPSARRP